MSQITSEIILSAPREVVWEVLTQMNAYHSWNSQFRLINGKVGEGERLTLCYSPLYYKNYIFKTRIHQYERLESFGWKGGLVIPGLLNAECRFEISAVDEQSTRLNFYQRYSGIMSWALSRDLIFRDARKSCIKLNAEIRQRVERLFVSEAVLSA